MVGGANLLKPSNQQMTIACASLEEEQVLLHCVWLGNGVKSSIFVLKSL